MSKFIRALFFLLPFIFTNAATAQTLSQSIHGVELGDTVQQVESKLEGHYAEIDKVDSEQVNFPLAQDSESHIVCDGLTTTDGHSIGSITFSFAEDHLVMITAAGNACSSLRGPSSKPQSTIGDWLIYNDMHLVANKKTDTVWLLNDDAVHAHMFLWDQEDQRNSALIDATVSEVLKFGSSYRTLSKKLKALSIASTKEQISPPTIPTNPKQQTQLNCYGFEYAGAPRKLEAVFADGRLAMVWILTAKGEEDRIRQALIRSYGEPIFVSDEIEAFDEWKVALRKDKPEIVAISDQLIPFMKSFFGG